MLPVYANGCYPVSAIGIPGYIPYQCSSSTAAVFTISGCCHMHMSVSSHPFLPGLVWCCVLCLFSALFPFSNESMFLNIDLQTFGLNCFMCFIACTRFMDSRWFINYGMGKRVVSYYPFLWHTHVHICTHIDTCRRLWRIKLPKDAAYWQLSWRRQSISMTTGSSKWIPWVADAEKKVYAEWKPCALPETCEADSRCIDDSWTVQNERMPEAI